MKLLLRFSGYSIGMLIAAGILFLMVIIGTFIQQLLTPASLITPPRSIRSIGEIH